VTDADRRELRDSVMRHEGLRLTPYHDTVGKITIGYGRNLADVGITRAEAAILLDHDLERAEVDARKALPWFDTLNGVRQAVVIEMCFNLGLTRLLGFTNTLKAMQAGRYEQAAAGMLNSKWAQQVGHRAQTLARQMRTGER
jgi:lysozyme